MGRLPKGFKKTLQHKDEDAPAQASAPAAPVPAPTAKAKGEDKAAGSSFLKETSKPAPAAAPPPPVASSARDEDEDDEEEGASTSGPESRSQMIKRHKKEMQAFKKNLPRLGKKSKEEIAKLTADLEAKQAKEFATLPDTDAAGEEEESGGANAGTSTTAKSVPAVQAGMGALHVGGDEEGADGGAKGHMTKAMKRRQKAAQSEAEREARIAAEAAAAGPSARVVEEEALVALLQPMGLVMRDIRADGHCLYRSLEDQLTLVGGTSGTGGTGGTEYQQLRSAAAAHMRQHPDQYSAFMDLEDDETPAQALERHCKEVESTAAWGGQLELSVLAQVLKRPIRVYTVGMAPITLGEEFAGDERPPLQVCYLRHAFGLGEHYNSLETVSTA